MIVTGYVLSERGRQIKSINNHTNRGIQTIVRIVTKKKKNYQYNAKNKPRLT